MGYNIIELPNFKEDESAKTFKKRKKSINCFSCVGIAFHEICHKRPMSCRIYVLWV